MFLPIWIDEIGKSQDKSIDKISVSSICTDWSIQSVLITSDLPIFFDLSTDKSIPISIDLLPRVTTILVVIQFSIGV